MLDPFLRYLIRIEAIVQMSRHMPIFDNTVNKKSTGRIGKGRDVFAQFSLLCVRP